jgi:hypothetical protein
MESLAEVANNILINNEQNNRLLLLLNFVNGKIHDIPNNKVPLKNDKVLITTDNIYICIINLQLVGSYILVNKREICHCELNETGYDFIKRIRADREEKKIIFHKERSIEFLNTLFQKLNLIQINPINIIGYEVSCICSINDKNLTLIITPDINNFELFYLFIRSEIKNHKFSINNGIDPIILELKKIISKK